MESQDTRIYYNYNSLYSQKKIPEEVYQCAKDCDENQNGVLEKAEFNIFANNYNDEEREKYYMVTDELSLKDKYSNYYDSLIPEEIKDSDLVSEKEKNKLRRRSMATIASMLVAMGGCVTMSASHLLGLPDKAVVAGSKWGMIIAIACLAATVLSN